MEERRTIFIVDGKRILGKSFIVNNNKTSKAKPTFKDVATLNCKLSSIVSNYADDCELDAILWGNEADDYSTKVEKCQDRIKRFESRSAYFQKKIDFWRQVRSYTVSVLSFIGFIGGIVLAISQVLRFHGPTVSILSTTISAILYFISGAFLCYIISRLVKSIINRVIRLYKNLLNKNEEMLAEIRSEKKLSSLKVEKYLKESNTKRKKARLVRGLH